ncbi:MAG: translation initiation factor 2 [Bacillota bacterium]
MLAEERQELLNKIDFLEAKLTQLKISRKTLFYLLEKLECDKRQQICTLELENKKLKLKNSHLIGCLYKNKKVNLAKIEQQSQ